MDYKNNILELIGNTPLIKLQKTGSNFRPQIFAKLESFNPGGSIKDRIGIAMIEDAERRGLIQPGGTIIEATSGNTGIGLALAAIIKGYKTIFVMTDKVCCEKSNYLKALGAEVIMVPNSLPKDNPNHYTNVAKRIAESIPNSLNMNQYSNLSNPDTHYRTTGPEIWRQTEGRITHFVAAMGTGGTLSGIAKYLKEQNPSIKIIGADPDGSVFKNYYENGTLEGEHPYLVEAIGQNYLPENVHFELIDRIISASDEDSFNAAKLLTRQEGIFCGGSTGTIFHAVMQIAAELDENGVIVFIVCDTGERYLTKFYNDEWVKEKLLVAQDENEDSIYSIL